MGQKESKPEPPPLPDHILDMYIRSEFNAMDTDKDGRLSRQEVRDLLMLLGFKHSKQKLKLLHVPRRKDTVGLDDFVTSFKTDPVLIKKTERFRQMFKLFDNDSEGYATKEEVLKGLEELDIEIDAAIKETVEKMDTNDDGKVSYQEFLALEFQVAMRLKEERKKKSIFDDD